MANIKRANALGITKPGTAISDVPDAPTIGTATGGQAAATVTFTPATTGGTPTSYTATSSPGSITGTASSSPITVSGLTNGTAYTFTVTATNSTGTSPASSASSPVTPVSLGDMDPIAMVEVGSSGSSTITFSSIPQTYTHLQLRLMAKNTSTSNTGDYASMRFNSDSGMNYTYHRLKGDGSTASAYSAATGTFSFVVLERITTSRSATFATQEQGVVICEILDYTNTNKYTTTRSLGGYDSNGEGEILLMSSLWTNTAAITSITLTTPSENFAQYSHFALYGIKGA